MKTLWQCEKKGGHTYTEINALDPQLALAFTGPAHCFTLLVYSHHTFSAHSTHSTLPSQHQTADEHSYPQAGEHRARYFPLELVKNRVNIGLRFVRWPETQLQTNSDAALRTAIVF